MQIDSQKVGSKTGLEIFNTSTGKYNTSVKLTEEDKKQGVKIYCHEPYAQEVYDKFSAYYKENGVPKNKDLQEGQVLRVTAKTILFINKTIIAEDKSTKSTLVIPFKEYSKSLDDLAKGISLEFLVMIYKATKSGEYLASEKKCISLNSRQELFDHLGNNTWFDVKIVKLIKGGYLAIYKDSVECFVPGSHAAANIIHNFNSLLGKTITVMVDNYDKVNKLFILSNKKYIAQSMPTRITELKFDTKYSGKLTNTPYDFGVFVEFGDGYFTGLLHKSEFENYETARKTMKAGDPIDFYIKDVTSKGGKYRVVLTLDQTQVNSEKQAWEKFRERTENQSFEYDLDKAKNSIKIYVDDSNFEVNLKKSDMDKNFSKYPLIKVFKVDPINKHVKFKFIDKE